MNPSHTAPPPPTAGPHLLGSSLRRSSSDRLVLGVCGGVAGATGTNVTAVRLGTLAISVVLLPVALLGYLVTAMIMPRDDGATLVGPGRRDRRDVVTAVIATILSAPVVLGAADGSLITTDDTFPALFLGTIALGIALLVRRQDRSRVATAVAPGQPPSAAAHQSYTTPNLSKALADAPEAPTFVRPGVGGPPSSDPPTPGEPPAQPGPRRRGLALPVLSIMALIPAVFAVLLTAGAIDSDYGAWSVMLALLAVASAGGAVAIAILRPSYLGAGLLVALAASFGALSIIVNQVGPVLDDGVGERTFHPGSVNELRHPYLLGVGEMTIDLRDLRLPKGSRTPIDATLGFGHLRVIVPKGARVTGAPTTDVTDLTASAERTGAAAAQVDGAPVIELDLDVRGAQIDLLTGDAIHVENLTVLGSQTTGFWGSEPTNQP